ncbi:hypothetical protein ACK8OR_09975 [Jannaschia sp. KMU-145]|uniref:hypothetical protein n=1 Tax=Jannaschia halovivens TaxID=3388667 RepID=UPI00396B367D
MKDRGLIAILERSAVVRLADIALKRAIFAAVAVWVAEFDDRAAAREDARRERIKSAFMLLAQQTFLQIGGPIPALALQDLADESISVRGRELTGGIYEDVTLDGTVLSEGEFYDLTSENASLKYVRFDNSVFAETVTFRSVDLTGASFVGVDLDDAVYEDVTGLRPKMFDGAKKRADAIFPDRFGASAIATYPVPGPDQTAAKTTIMAST